MRTINRLIIALLPLIVLTAPFVARAQDAWVLQTSGTPQDLTSVHFTDADTGWAVGLSGTILKTTDGGANWTAQNSGTTQALYSIHFTDADTGWAVGLSGTILKTTDGGGNWAVQTSGTTEYLISVHFTDADTGWAVGNIGTILKTTDGGGNWAVQSSGTAATLRSVHFTNSTTGWVVGSGGTILKTTDGGGNWAAQESGTTQGLTSVHFTDATTGWVVGNIGTILKTTDGWAAQASGTTQGLTSVYFTDADTGWAVGQDGAILKTTDGGDNWAVQSSVATERLYSVHFTDATTGWAVGDSGTILKYEGNPPPSPPALVSPSDGTGDQALDPTLVWNSPGGATTYRLQVSTDESFETLVFEDSTLTDTAQALEELTFATTYYWRVNARNAGGSSGWSEVWSFTTRVPMSLVPREFFLEQFGYGQGGLRFALPERAHVRVRLFDLRGELSMVILNEVREAAVYRLPMPRVTDGVYLLDFRAGEFHRTVKMAR